MHALGPLRVKKTSAEGVEEVILTNCPTTTIVAGSLVRDHLTRGAAIKQWAHVKDGTGSTALD